MQNQDTFLIALLSLALIAIAGLFLAWFFMRRAKFKEKILLIEKGIDIKDLNLMGDKKTNSPLLRIGILITGTALGALLVGMTNFDLGIRRAIIVLFTGISVILAYFIDAPKAGK